MLRGWYFSSLNDSLGMHGHYHTCVHVLLDLLFSVYQLQFQHGFLSSSVAFSVLVSSSLRLTVKKAFLLSAVASMHFA